MVVLKRNQLGGVLVILAGITLAGCEMQNGDSFSNDSSTYGNSPVSGTSNFVAASAVLKSNCIQCHSYFATYSEQDFISNGYVVAGSPANSELFQYLAGSGVSGPQDMPQGEPALSAANIQIIETWISGISD